MSSSRRKEITQRFGDHEENYQLLKEGQQGQKRTRDSLDMLDTDGILQKFVQLSDKMIGIADGSIAERDIVDPVNPERSMQKPDTIVFLDKSARPVADFVDAFWEQLAQDGEEKPQYEFLNIDRVSWFMDQGYDREEAETVLGPADFDINKVRDEDIARIRAYFTIGELTEENWQEEVNNLPTRLDGQNLLIVDEVRSQGGTLSIATQLLRRAIPEAVVSGAYFWETTYTQMADGKNKADSVPVWYDKTNTKGRGIGDISTTYYSVLYEKEPTQQNLRSKLASFALSAPHHTIDERTGEIIYEDDKRYNQLKQDIAYATYGLADGRIMHSPAGARSEDEQSEILARQGVTAQEATAWRATSKRLKKQQETQDKIDAAQAARATQVAKQAALPRREPRRVRL